MSLPAFASPSDLEAWSGESFDSSGFVRVSAMLSAASTLIRAHTGRVWVGADGDAEAGVSEMQLDVLRTVAVMVAGRLWSNPGARVSQSAGPFSEAYERGSQGLVLTLQERAMLAPVLGGVPGLSSVRVVAPKYAAGVPRGSGCGDDEWVL